MQKFLVGFEQLKSVNISRFAIAILRFEKIEKFALRIIKLIINLNKY